ncbi:MAG: pilus assembly protein TadG-related protein [Specibacter sp.]
MSQTAGRRPRTRDDGQIMVLLIGYVLLALLLVTVVAAGSSLYIGHKQLLSAADGAALAAADTFVLNGGTAGTDPGTLLTDRGVTAAALEFLAGEQAPGSLSDIALAAGTGAPDGRTAQVRLSGVVHPLFINFLVPGGIAITVTGTARAHLVL